MLASAGDESGASSITERLVSLMERPIDTADRSAAVLRIVDWLGCAVGGWNTPVGTALTSLAPPALFDPETMSPPERATSLGSLGSILEMDDVHREALLHPGPVVVPAAIAVASDDTRDLLDAVVVGYEAMIRLGRSVGPRHYAYFHNTATCGAIGAAAAAGRALSLTAPPMADALGNAMSLAGGLWQCRNERVMTKPLHVAEATGRGVRAALLASAGVTGPRFILEGPQGFFAALAPDASSHRVLDDADAPWLLHETSYKPWPACRHAHPAIDAALLLRDRLDGQPIREIVITTYADAVVFCDKPEPRTPAEAKFSLQHAVAVVLSQGVPTLADFEPEALRRPELVHLRGLSSVVADERFTKGYPRHFGAALRITTEDGRSHEAEVRDAWGDSENPMNEGAILGKYGALMARSGVPADISGPLLDATLDLNEEASTHEFHRCLSALRRSVPLKSH